MSTRVIELHRDSRPVRWGDPTNGLRSLAELLRIFAETYVEIGAAINSWIVTNRDEPDAVLSPENYRAFRACLRDLQGKCDEVGLEVLEKLLERTLVKVSKEITYKEAADKATQLNDCLQSELESKCFFFVPSNRAEYTATSRGDEIERGRELKRFDPVLVKFPSAKFDIEQTGNAFALGLFTASVYHLMRVCEYGLVSLARVLGINPGNSSWESILRKIKHTLDANSSTKPVHWKADEQFYSEAAAQMNNVRNAWRNPVSHIPRIYGESEARRVFNGVEGLMLHLSTRLSETDMPSIRVLADPEAEAETKRAESATG